mmetsp:Transcript_14984/g.20946  ORF Transcript_14984/g.20946 Transcript_14984/m.20946 type:complete len:161 (-) Transcript_14984:102-584(-)
MSTSIYDSDVYEDEGAPTHCCNIKVVVLVVCILPLLAGVALIIVSLFVPCLEYGPHECTIDGKDFCCDLACDEESNGFLTCDEVDIWSEFFVFGLILCGVSVGVFVVVSVVYYLRSRSDSGGEFIPIADQGPSSTYKRDENAYTVSYDTYPPTYHSHGPR